MGMLGFRPESLSTTSMAIIKAIVLSHDTLISPVSTFSNNKLVLGWINPEIAHVLFLAYLIVLNSPN